MPDHPPTNLAHNLRRLRDLRGLTQQQLADVSGVPRPTLAHLESGAANPTLSVMMRVASALQATIEQLIAPARQPVRQYAASALASHRRNHVQVRELLAEPLPGLCLERIQLDGGARLRHADGGRSARRYVACEQGEIECQVEDEVWHLGSGDVAVVDPGCELRLSNRKRRAAVAYTMAAPAPVGH